MLCIPGFVVRGGSVSVNLGVNNETRSLRDVDLQTHTENSLDRTCNEQRSIKKT